MYAYNYCTQHLIFTLPIFFQSEWLNNIWRKITCGSIAQSGCLKHLQINRMPGTPKRKVAMAIHALSQLSICYGLCPVRCSLKIDRGKWEDSCLVEGSGEIESKRNIWTTKELSEDWLKCFRMREILVLYSGRDQKQPRNKPIFAPPPSASLLGQQINSRSLWKGGSA